MQTNSFVSLVILEGYKLLGLGFNYFGGGGGGDVQQLNLTRVGSFFEVNFHFL